MNHAVYLNVPQTYTAQAIRAMIVALYRPPFAFKVCFAQKPQNTAIVTAPTPDGILEEIRKLEIEVLGDSRIDAILPPELQRGTEAADRGHIATMKHKKRERPPLARPEKVMKARNRP
jgi:hypothetical protein